MILYIENLGKVHSFRMSVFFSAECFTNKFAHYTEETLFFHDQLSNFEPSVLIWINFHSKSEPETDSEDIQRSSLLFRTDFLRLQKNLF